MRSPVKKIKPAFKPAMIDFLLEAGLLKRVKRSGWWVAGIEEPETVAEHSFRTAVIGLLLANLEKADSYQVLLMTLFNDIHEARINDLHKLGQRYVDFPKAEEAVFKDQLKSLPESLAGELAGSRKDYRSQKSKESLVARDADILECLLQAKEYEQSGKLLAKNFFKKAPLFLKTRSARLFWQSIKTCSVERWWMKLSVFER